MRDDIEKESDWILPANLEVSQQLFKEQNFDDVDASNDFGSYKLLNGNRMDSRIELHNATGRAAETLALSIRRVVLKYGISCQKIADMGCGAGFITAEVAKLFPSSIVNGFDIAKDAIDYASTNFKGITFSCIAITPEMSFPEKYDLIYSNEFYPFTRTDSFKYYCDYMDTFFNNLSNNKSVLILGMANQEKCLLKQYDKIVHKYCGKYKIFKVIIPASKIQRVLKNYFLSQCATKILNKICKRKDQYLVVCLSL